MRAGSVQAGGRPNTRPAYQPCPARRALPRANCWCWIIWVDAGFMTEGQGVRRPGATRPTRVDRRDEKLAELLSSTGRSTKMRKLVDTFSEILCRTAFFRWCEPRSNMNGPGTRPKTANRKASCASFWPRLSCERKAATVVARSRRRAYAAMVGGRDYGRQPVSTRAGRRHGGSPGSSFKPLRLHLHHGAAETVFKPNLDRGRRPRSASANWCPQNYRSLVFRFPVTLDAGDHGALESIVVPGLKLSIAAGRPRPGRKLAAPKIVEVARRFGHQGAAAGYAHRWPIGSDEVSVVEHAVAYCDISRTRANP